MDVKYTKIWDKIKEIKKYNLEIQTILPKEFKKFNNLKDIATGERYLEKITESITDLIKLVIKAENLEIIQNGTETLESNSIISKEISIKIKKAKGMRNIIAHKYGDIDIEILYQVLKNNINKDSEQLIKEIKDFYKETSN